MNKTRIAEIKTYVTQDGSLIRELMHPTVHGNVNQSLAEAVVAVGKSTKLHRHHRTEEIYHVTQGEGLMFLGEEKFSITQGDTVCILPGTPHRVENTGGVDLRILCSCSPPYAHDDTELL